MDAMDSGRLLLCTGLEVLGPGFSLIPFRMGSTFYLMGILSTRIPEVSFYVRASRF
jgi:hypothetical protein